MNARVDQLLIALALGATAANGARAVCDLFRTTRPAQLPRPMPDAEVLFVGDSAAWGWTYWGTPSFAELGGRTQNLGLPSYRAAHLLADAHRLAGSRADVVVVQLGAADVSGRAIPEDIATVMLQAVEAVHAAIPDATVLVLELVPRVTPEAAGRTVDVNLRLRDSLDLSVIGDEWSLPYARFVDLDVEPGPDGVHLDAEGYAALERQVGPLIHSLRGEK